MINEIKTIIKNYVENAKLCKLIIGIVETDGIRISERMLIPSDLIVGNSKALIIPGQKVRLMRDHGGQQFYLLEVIDE